ncbi:MAG: SCO family protein [Planctomycetota bacterium]
MQRFQTLLFAALIIAAGVFLGLIYRNLRGPGGTPGDVRTIKLDDGRTIRVAGKDDGLRDYDRLPGSGQDEDLSDEPDFDDLIPDPNAPPAQPSRDELVAMGLDDDEIEVVMENREKNRGTTNVKIITDPNTPQRLARYTLTERSGDSFDSDSLKGTPHVVSFFYSSCPSICVMQNKKVSELQKEFGGRDIKFVSISVDPDKDTPQQLTEYAARFGADPDQWLFLTGEWDNIRRISNDVYHAYASKENHIERLLLIDRQGELAFVCDWSEPRRLKRLRQKIREMLRES